MTEALRKHAAWPVIAAWPKMIVKHGFGELPEEMCALVLAFAAADRAALHARLRERLKEAHRAPFAAVLAELHRHACYDGGNLRTFVPGWLNVRFTFHNIWIARRGVCYRPGKYGLERGDGRPRCQCAKCRGRCRYTDCVG